MPNPIIEGFRTELLSNDFIPDDVKKRMSINKLNRTFNKPNNTKEELSMSNANLFTQQTPGGTLPRPGGSVGAGLPGASPVGMGVPGAQVAPGVGGNTNLIRQNHDIIRQKMRAGTKFRPKAIVVDGDEVERYVYDSQRSDLVAFKEAWREQNKRPNKKTQQIEKPKINDLRAVKLMCLEQPGKTPKDFAQMVDGVPVTKTKPSSIKGVIISFPETESGNYVTDIIRRPDLMNAISNRGGFGVAGTYEEAELDKSKYEIPVAIMITPTSRKKDSGSVETTLRTTALITPTRKKQLFPEGRNNVGMFDIFNRFPFDGYELNRVVPLKIYEKEEFGGKQVAVVDLDPKTQLARYKSEWNNLEDGQPGAEIMKALGITAEQLRAAFTNKTSTALETEDDFLKYLDKAYLSKDAGPDVQKYLNAAVY